MTDKDLETLVNTCADASDYGGLDTSTMYGNFALDVAKAVRERCAKLVEKVADDCDEWRPLDGSRGVALRAAAVRIRGA